MLIEILIEAYPVALRKEDKMIKIMIKTATTLVKVSVLYVVAMAVFMTLGFTISKPVFDSKSDICGRDDWL